jgi:hypothetical protein
MTNECLGPDGSIWALQGVCTDRESNNEQEQKVSRDMEIVSKMQNLREPLCIASESPIQSLTIEKERQKHIDLGSCPGVGFSIDRDTTGKKKIYRVLVVCSSAFCLMLVSRA